MFDTLTRAEREALNLKLADWAHSFFEVGHTLARVALAEGDYSGQMWDRREQYVDTRNEIEDVRAELVLA